MSRLQVETWKRIPGHEMYEASNEGLVRSWKVPGSNMEARADAPRVLSGRVWQGSTYYNLDGVDLPLVKILFLTYGSARGCEVAGSDRDLDVSVLEEIRSYEGIKHAHEVGLDFRIDPSRVRSIWDSKNPVWRIE